MALLTQWILIPFLFFLASCSTTSIISEKKEIPQNVPNFLKEKAQNKTNVVFYKITKPEGSFYEVEWQDQGHWFSEVYTQDGVLHESEELLKMQDLPPSIEAKMRQDLERRYQNVNPREIQKVKDQNKKEFYELKIATKNVSTGFVEVRYSLDGEWMGEQTLELEPLPTLY